MLAGVLVSVAMTATVLAPGPRSSLAGLSLDSLFWLRQHLAGVRHTAAQSPVVLVTIDEETYRTEPFRGTPAVMWTPYLALVLRGVLDAAPAVVGMDLILPTTVDAFLPGYDRDFLRVLHAGGTAGKLVLGKVQAEGPPILPFAGQILAVGGDRNVRSTNEPEDADGIVRRLAYSFATGSGGREPSLAVELAARAAGLASAAPQTRSALGVAATSSDEVLLNFDGGMPFPIYSVADLYGCAKAGDSAFFREHFAGKVVMLATLLDVEDRKLTSRRFINTPERANGDRCLPQPAAAATPPPAFARATLPGVFIHATAIQNMLQHETARQLGFASRSAVTLLVAGLAASLALLARLRWAVAIVVLLAAATVIVPTLIFQTGLELPMIEMTLALVGSFLLMLAYRYAVADRDRRLIRTIFGLYMAPSLVDGMMAAHSLPKLGGERRTVTIFFSDIAGFTTLSERSDPALLAPVLNAYFDGVCDIVMAEGGLVVEFLGDGVLAVFGAPSEQPDHARRGVTAARRVDEFTERFRASELPAGIVFGATRIGVHSGQAVVGNFGSTRRLKYAAMGDAVNTASRIEGLNKYFGTRVCISGEAKASSGDTDVRPMGRVQLKGKTQSLDIFEVLPAGVIETPPMQAYLTAFAALSAGDPGAEQGFAALAADEPPDPPAAFHLGRMRAGERTSVIVMADK